MNSNANEKSLNYITHEMVERISHSKNEPKWMLEKRLKSLEILGSINLPNFGPTLKDLDLSKITYYKDPQDTNQLEQKSWDDVPQDIKDTFEKLGIPQAEREYLGGVGAQYDSGMVYHNIKESLRAQGVIFENMDTAVIEHEELVREYFMSKCVLPSEHYFAAMHGAVWSGGTFIYVPKGVRVSMPLQAYFRIGSEYSGQFEHTLIIVDEGAYVEYIEGCSAPKGSGSNLHAGCVEIFVKKNAEVKYISIENWSRNTYNLNTKKAIVEEGGKMNWINANMGSRVTMLYPTTVLLGDNSKNESLGIAFASSGQEQDTGSKVIHVGSNTSSIIKSKSITEGTGANVYRGYIEVTSNAKNAKSYSSCDSLLIGSHSVSDAHPMNNIKSSDAIINHEAKISHVDESELAYLKLYGLSSEESYRVVVGGYVGDMVAALPLEYAVEFNRLLDLEIEQYTI